jgi:phospholipid/cholesterol/gamma-HCH transport system ATP-binding protein
MSDPNPQSKNVGVEVIDLHRSFGGNEVLKGVSFNVQAGELFVIMGPSGSGKTILLKHIIGLEKPDSGQILVGGDSIQDPAVRDKYRMAMVFQSDALLTSLTVGQNVGLYLAEHQLKSPAEIAAIVARQLEAVGLPGLENSLPSELSGGMQKRVAIARALVVEPQLILFDEPTSELDPLMAVTIGREIYTLNKRTGATVIVVSHDRDLAFSIADRIAIISEGRIIFIGTPTEVKQNKDPRVQKFIHAEISPSTSH